MGIFLTLLNLTLTNYNHLGEICTKYCAIVVHKIDLFLCVLVANNELALVYAVQTNFVLAVAGALTVLNLVEKVYKCKSISAAGELQQILKNRVGHELKVFAEKEAFMEDRVLELVGFFINQR